MQNAQNKCMLVHNHLYIPYLQQIISQTLTGNSLSPSKEQNCAELWSCSKRCQQSVTVWKFFTGFKIKIQNTRKSQARHPWSTVVFGESTFFFCFLIKNKPRSPPPGCLSAESFDFYEYGSTSIFFFKKYPGGQYSYTRKFGLLICSPRGSSDLRERSIASYKPFPLSYVYCTYGGTKSFGSTLTLVLWQKIKIKTKSEQSSGRKSKQRTKRKEKKINRCDRWFSGTYVYKHWHSMWWPPKI